MPRERVRMMKTILLVEDDENLRRGLAFALDRDGYRTVCAGSIAQAKRQLERQAADLIVLDIGLPDGDGMVFCSELRKSAATPVILLTARDLETDEVAGLLAGADDYVTKPFSLSVLRARVEALLRRAEPLVHPAENSAVLVSGRYRLDTALCRLTKDAREIPVSATEYRLLFYFMQHPGQVLSKEQLLSSLWDVDGNFVDENTLPVNVSRLRMKLEDDPKNPQTIKTVYGVGYRWNGGEEHDHN